MTRLEPLSHTTTLSLNGGGCRQKWPYQYNWCRDADWFTNLLRGAGHRIYTWGVQHFSPLVPKGGKVVDAR